MPKQERIFWLWVVATWTCAEAKAPLPFNTAPYFKYRIPFGPN